MLPSALALVVRVVISGARTGCESVGCCGCAATTAMHLADVRRESASGVKVHTTSTNVTLEVSRHLTIARSDAPMATSTVNPHSRADAISGHCSRTSRPPSRMRTEKSPTKRQAREQIVGLGPGQVWGRVTVITKTRWQVLANTVRTRSTTDDINVDNGSAPGIHDVNHRLALRIGAVARRDVRKRVIVALAQ